ncbi:MAG TPA: hypothetical protein VGT79_03455, partial [Xanthomonadaceae bacterium]|nr:hypothetical protein [Xanthomonadaceae bacterium]
MRFIKRALLVAFGVFVLWFGLALSHWLPLTTDVQRKALAIMAAPPEMAKGQHNAFATLWLAQYDIPAADMDKVMAADIARFHPASTDEAAAGFVSSAEGHYPKQAPEPVSAQVLCSLKDEDCLAKVRENTGAIRKVLSEHDLVLDHLRSLDSADYYQSIFPDSLNSPIPSFLGNGQLQIADAAVQFVDGDKAEGLTRACSTANNWRRLAIHSDNLIAKMLGVAIFDAAADLFADMLAEMPADAPLPD